MWVGNRKKEGLAGIRTRGLSQSTIPKISGHRTPAIVRMWARKDKQDKLTKRQSYH